MPKQTNDEFLKEFDRFGQPVGLTYKNNPSYNTGIGGVMTMLTFFIFMAWLAMEVIDVYMPPGKHTVKSSLGVTQKLNSAWPLEQLSSTDFFVAYNLTAREDSKLSQDMKSNGRQMGQYFTGLWLQREEGIVTRVWPGIPCHELYDQYEVSMMFWEQIAGHYCPDMSKPMPAYESGEKPVVKIQNPSSYNKNNTSSDFVFVIDSCANLQDFTDAECQDDKAAVPFLNDVIVSTRIQTTFWNTKNFLRNGWEMNSQWQSNEVQLNNDFFQRQAYTLMPNAITFRNSHIINIPYMPKWDPGKKYRSYDCSAPFNSIWKASADTPDPDETNPLDTWFSMRFTQDSKTNAISSTREALSNTFQRFGSYLALILRFAGYVLGAYQKFNFDNSMTKKLYNYVNENEEQQPYNPEIPATQAEFQNNLIAEARDRRKPFRYSGWRFFSKKNFSSPWCLCCRHTDTAEDKLQGKARTRLYGELDILNIIQQLRVARFVGELKLSPEQKYLVNYHSEYMLFRDDARAPTVNFARYTDHRKEDDISRAQRVRRNVVDCVMSLNPQLESHQETYRRIMARGRVIDDDMAHADDDDNDGADGPARGNQVDPAMPNAGYNALAGNRLE